jgi:hypothetical protein
MVLALADPVMDMVLVTTSLAGERGRAAAGRGERDASIDNSAYDKKHDYEPSELSEPLH